MSRIVYSIETLIPFALMGTLGTFMSRKYFFVAFLGADLGYFVRT